MYRLCCTMLCMCFMLVQQTESDREPTIHDREILKSKPSTVEPPLTHIHLTRPPSDHSIHDTAIARLKRHQQDTELEPVRLNFQQSKVSGQDSDLPYIFFSVWNDVMTYIYTCELQAYEQTTVFLPYSLRLVSPPIPSTQIAAIHGQNCHLTDRSMRTCEVLVGIKTCALTGPTPLAVFVLVNYIVGQPRFSCPY